MNGLIRPSVHPSVCLYVCLSVCDTFLTMFPTLYHHEIFRSYHLWLKWFPCKMSRSEVKCQGHMDHDPTWSFPDRNASLNSRMAAKFYTNLNQHRRGVLLFCLSSDKFQGHAGQKTQVMIQIERFWTLTSVWIHRWLRNDAQSLN